MNKIFVIYYNKVFLKISHQLMWDFENGFETKNEAKAMIEKIYKLQPTEPYLHLYKSHFSIEMFKKDFVELANAGMQPIGKGRKMPNYRAKAWEHK